MWKRLFLGIFILLAFEAGLFLTMFPPWFVLPVANSIRLAAELRA